MPDDVQAIRQCYLQMNRLLTWSLVALVAIVSAVLWLLGVASTEEHSIKIGLVLMGLAVVFYKLPYLSYWYTRRRFKSHPQAQALFNGDWKSFRSWANQA